MSERGVKFNLSWEKKEDRIIVTWFTNEIAKPAGVGEKMAQWFGWNSSKEYSSGNTLHSLIKV